jgi:hypothetical protein
MRLPVIPGLSTKDGTANKNARLTNMLREKNKGVVRPGLSSVLDYAGVGAGLVPFNGRLIMLFGDTVYDAVEFGGIGGGAGVDLTTVAGTKVHLGYLPWNSAYIYPNGTWVTYGGANWVSVAGGNLNHAPAQNSWWSSTWFTGTWDDTTTYNIGDSVIVNGVTYYSAAPNNVGNNPVVGIFSPGSWMLTAPGATRYYVFAAGMPDYASTGAAVAAYAAAQIEGGFCSNPDGYVHCHDLTATNLLTDCIYASTGIHQYSNFLVTPDVRVR